MAGIRNSTQRLAASPYKIFVSHGSADLWVAGQIAKELRLAGVEPFLDETNIPKGARDFSEIIRKEILLSRELIALFTPWSARRSWVWTEIGAAWSNCIPVVGVFYGMLPKDLDRSAQGQGVLTNSNMIQLAEFTTYLEQLSLRVKGAGR